MAGVKPVAGAVKLLSGDPTWQSFTALEYHFWTQPLPTPLAWYAAQLPAWLLIGGTAATLVIEAASKIVSRVIFSTRGTSARLPYAFSYTAPCRSRWKTPPGSL